MTDRLKLNWISYIMHCFAFCLQIVGFGTPFWYFTDNSMNDYDSAGLWAKCQYGQGCSTWSKSPITPAINLVPIQVLMTLAVVFGFTSFIFYSLWLWKGERCDTPWRKSCTMCRETYQRSWKPKTPETSKYRRMKWCAFAFSCGSGVLCLIAVIIFMIRTLVENGGKPQYLGFSGWLSLCSSVLLLVMHGVITLCFYLLRASSLNDGTAENGEETWPGDDSHDEKEIQRIQAWIVEQKDGLDNPSFTRDWEVPRSPSIYRTRSMKSSSRDSIYYSGQTLQKSHDESNRSSYSNPSVMSSRVSRGSCPPASVLSNSYTDRRSTLTGRKGSIDKNTRFSPLYSVIFKGKVPMIPKGAATENTRAKYDVIYGWSKGTLPPVLSGYFGNKYDNKNRSLPNRRPDSHLGVSSDYDTFRVERDFYGKGRRLSDSNLDKHARDHHRRRSDDDQTSEDMYDTSYGDGSPVLTGPFLPGELPEIHRRRKHPERRSMSSLSSVRTPDPLDQPSDGYRVRTKYPDISDESFEVPRSAMSSRGVPGLDLEGAEEFQVDNIWVVPDKAQIPEMLGRSKVHFQLEKSIAELEEFEELEGLDVDD